MLKFEGMSLLIFVVFLSFFAGTAGALEGGTMPAADAEETLAQAQAATDPDEAFSLYCQAARLGSGPAQYHVGKALAGGDRGEGINMAAGLLWLDMAIVNGVAEAKEARRHAGRRAEPDDFTRYRAYNRRRMEMPCGPAAED